VPWPPWWFKFYYHRFPNNIIILWGCQPHAQPPTWRTRVSLFVWVITFDMSGMGDPASSYATAGIALRIIWPRKPHHYVKVYLRWGLITLTPVKYKLVSSVISRLSVVFLRLFMRQLHTLYIAECQGDIF
jgi:hypothetical protein